MYYYKLGYWTHDGQAALELAHPQAFSPEQFKRLVYRATEEVVREEALNQPHLPFAWIYDHVADRLVEAHGFRRLTYTAEFEIYGSGSILAGDPDLPDLDALTRHLSEQGLI